MEIVPDMSDDLEASDLNASSGETKPAPSLPVGGYIDDIPETTKPAAPPSSMSSPSVNPVSSSETPPVSNPTPSPSPAPSSPSNDPDFAFLVSMISTDSVVRRRSVTTLLRVMSTRRGPK